MLGSTRFVELWSRPNRTAVATVNSTLSATFLNEFTVSASSDGLGEANSDPDCGARCRRSTYGVSYPFLFPADSKFDPEKLPTLSITGLSTLDNGPYPGYWSGFTYAVSNSMTKVVNTHTLKWGIFVERSGQDDQIHATTASAPATNNQNGAFRFQDTGHPQATGLAMANALLGNFNDYSEFGAKPLTPFVGTALDWFVQDSWKMSQKLTLEAGLRHSIWQPWHSKWNTISMFHPDFYDPAQAAVVDPAGGFIVSGDRYNGVVLPGDEPTEEALSHFPFLQDYTHLYHGLPAGFAPTHKQDFQPRVGLAYTIDQKTIVRVGVGKFFNRTGINRDLAQGGQPPFMEQVTVINGSVDGPGGAQRRVFPFTITAQETTLKHPNAWTGNVTVQRQLPAASQWKCPTSRGAATTISESATSTSCCPEPFRRIPGSTPTPFGRFAAWASSVARRIPEGRSTTRSRSARTVGCRPACSSVSAIRFRGISTMDREKSSFCRMPTTTPAIGAARISTDRMCSSPTPFTNCRHRQDHG